MTSYIKGNVCATRETQLVRLKEMVKSILVRMRRAVAAVWRNEANDRKELRHFIYCRPRSP
jgi:hypothetical protein